MLMENRILIGLDLKTEENDSGREEDEEEREREDEEEKKEEEGLNVRMTRIRR